MNGSKTGHTYEAFTYLFGQNVFIRLLSANKNSADLYKLAILGLRLFIFSRKVFLGKVGSILDFSFDIDTDTGRKTSDSISIFSIPVE